jgi:hypothetical protein
MAERSLSTGRRSLGGLYKLRAAFIALSPMLGSFGTPAAAQEWSGGAMNPATVSGPMATQAAAEAQARRRGKPRDAVRGSPARSREICSDARSKVAAGDDNPRLPRLLALCEKGGY